jgi:hypothetical protein
MTGSSSKLLQIHGKWYRERKPKKNPKPEAKKKKKHPKTILQPYFLDVRSGLHSFTMDQGSHIKQELNIGISPTNMGPNMRKDKDTQIWAGAWLMGM